MFHNAWVVQNQQTDIAVVPKAPLQGLVAQYLMILAIPVLALMALLATAILAMPLVEPRRRTAAVVTIPLGTVESLQATEGLKCCHARHSGRTVQLRDLKP